jgi:hypothetical protein
VKYSVAVVPCFLKVRKQFFLKLKKFSSFGAQNAPTLHFTLHSTSFLYKRGYVITPTPSRLGGVVVSVLATGPKGCGFKHGQGDGSFKGDKNPQHTFLSDGK